MIYQNCKQPFKDLKVIVFDFLLFSLNYFPLGGGFRCRLITFATSLDPNQPRQYVKPRLCILSSVGLLLIRKIFQAYHPNYLGSVPL